MAWIKAPVRGTVNGVPGEGLTFRHERDGLSGLRLLADGDPTHAADIVAARTAELTDGIRTSLERMKAALEADTHRTPTTKERS